MDAPGTRDCSYCSCVVWGGLSSLLGKKKGKREGGREGRKERRRKGGRRESSRTINSKVGFLQ